MRSGYPRFETTEEIPPLEGMIGQDRALRALDLGLGLDEAGFNVFVSGNPGTGRNTALKASLDKAVLHRPLPPDWGYVHNFDDPTQPVPISLPCGMMGVLAADMEELIAAVQRDVPRAFESSEYAKRMNAAMETIESRPKEKMSGIERVANAAGFTLRSTPAGLAPVPVRNGQLRS